MQKSAQSTSINSMKRRSVRFNTDIIKDKADVIVIADDPVQESQIQTSADHDNPSSKRRRGRPKNMAATDDIKDKSIETTDKAPLKPSVVENSNNSTATSSASSSSQPETTSNEADGKQNTPTKNVQSTTGSVFKQPIAPRKIASLGKVQEYMKVIPYVVDTNKDTPTQSIPNNQSTSQQEIQEVRKDIKELKSIILDNQQYQKQVLDKMARDQQLLVTNQLCLHSQLQLLMATLQNNVITHNARSNLLGSLQHPQPMSFPQPILPHNTTSNHPFRPQNIAPNPPILPHNTAPNPPILPHNTAPNPPILPNNTAPNPPILPHNTAPNPPIDPAQTTPSNSDSSSNNLPNTKNNKKKGKWVNYTFQS